MKSMQPSGFYVLRRPLLPVDALFAFLQRTGAGTAEGELQRLFAQPHLQEAIYTASPSLFNRLGHWLRGEDIAEKEKLLKTLFKYLLRASTRCTPYGMFAGCTTAGGFAGQTRVRANPLQPYTRHTRLDMDYVAELTRNLTGEPHIQRQVKYFPNNSLYRVGRKYRFTYAQADGKRHRYSVCSVEASHCLETVFDAAAAGATLAQLATALLSHEVLYDEACLFVLQLVEEQILVSDIQLTVTGSQFHDVLIHKLSRLEDTDGWVQQLGYVQQLLGRQDEGVHKYYALEEALGLTPALAEERNLVQTDLFFNMAENQLGNQAIQTLTGAFEKLAVLNQGSYLADLEDFRKRFYERYEEQEVPLLTALDGEVGIGYGAKVDSTGYLPLIEGIQVPNAGNPSLIEWNFWKEFVLRKYSQTLFEGSQELVLTEQDLEHLVEKGAPANAALPGSFAAFGSLMAESAEAIDQGDFLFNLYSITGPSAVNLLTRFCHGSQALKEHVEACIKAEDDLQPDAIFAEVVHLPEERTGNILTRPAFRQYEIPYLAQASVDDPFRIPLSDLMVSVRNGKEVVLRSVRHNKRVFPRLTTAHDFSHGLGIYRFLCDLQFQRVVINVAWHWSILEKQSFLPRVRYRNIIVSRATWTLSVHNYPQLKQGGLDLPAFFAEVKTALRMPDFVTIAEADNEILVDFRNGHCLEILRETLLKKSTVTLKEYLQVPGQCFLHDAHGKYTNEIIIPFRPAGASPVPANNPVPADCGQVQRKFATGSEWLYLKVYTGEKTADYLLKEVFSRLVKEFGQKKLIDKWFFVRYTDPDYHLRIRFHGQPDSGFFGKIIDKVHQHLDQYLQDGVIYRIQTDTYKREIERYDPRVMQLTEDLFHFDSEATVSFLKLLSQDNDEQYRGLFILAGVEALLGDFRFTPQRGKQFLKSLQQSSLAEFDDPGFIKKQLDEKYRKDRPAIERMFEAGDVPGGMEERIRAILRTRSDRNRATIDAILSLVSSTELRIEELLASYIHMSINRVFISNPRLHELVVYHYLSKYLTSCMAKLSK